MPDIWEIMIKNVLNYAFERGGKAGKNKSLLELRCLAEIS